MIKHGTILINVNLTSWSQQFLFRSKLTIAHHFVHPYFPPPVLSNWACNLFWTETFLFIVIPFCYKTKPSPPFVKEENSKNIGGQWRLYQSTFKVFWALIYIYHRSSNAFGTTSSLTFRRRVLPSLRLPTHTALQIKGWLNHFWSNCDRGEWR